MRKIWILILAAMAVACSGRLEQTDRTFQAKSSVNAYFKYIRVVEGKLLPHPVIAADCSDEELKIMLSLVGEYAGSVYDLANAPYSQDAMDYERYQEKFGDFNPNASLYRYYTKKGGGEWMLESGNCKYYAYCEHIVSIEITSDKYWADGYAAGTNLAPLFTVEYASLADYVASGFTTAPVKVYREVVSELNREHTKLMMETDYNIYGGTDMAFFTSTVPENLPMHKVTITFNLDTGESISYSIKLTNLYM